MPAVGQPWPLDFKVVSSCFHVLAIGSGIFRLRYRWYISRFGCEDAWALLALLTDFVCPVVIWLQPSDPSYLTHAEMAVDLISTAAVTSVPWEARLSMISTIIRITTPRACIQRASYAAAASFGLMWIAVLAQKLYICGTNACAMTHGVAISQLITDVISDVVLLAMPIFFFKGIKISRSQRRILAPAFASSICITIISIVHCITLFMPLNGISLLVVYIKAALSLLICNLLVVVTFTYRFFSKTDVDLGGTSSKSGSVQLTTIIPAQLTLEGLSFSTPLPITSAH